MVVCSGLQDGASAAGTLFQRELWGTDGRVLAIAKSGNVLYIGGNFHTVGPPTGSGIPLDRSSGAVPPSYPRVVGLVYAACSDGQGGWFIGGNFTFVGEVRRTHLAHILANRTLASWAPVLDAPVEALRMSAGTLYVGGRFTTVDGIQRRALAAFDARNGLLQPLEVEIEAIPPVVAGVSALDVHGNRLVLGGEFDFVNGTPRPNLAEITLDGTLTSWNPAADLPVHALAVVDSVVFVGGEFTQCGDSARAAIAAVDFAGKATAWAPALSLVGGGQIGMRVLAFCRVGASLVVGGRFTAVDATLRRSLAVFDLATGVLTDTDLHLVQIPGVPNVNALAVTGGIVYVGGLFASAEGIERSHLLAFDPTAGLQSWNPRADGEVDAIAADASTVYAGGLFGSMGEWVRRPGIAALDLSTGRATSWNPSPDLSVYAVLPINGRVYVGGLFESIGGSPRQYLAAIDSITGLATPWNPRPDLSVSSLSVSEGTLYAAGGFNQMSGQSRRGGAAFDLGTDTLLAWNPNADDVVKSLACPRGSNFIGGWFSTIGGKPRSFVARLDPVSGLADSWDPGANSFVVAMTTADSLLYLSGAFSSVGGQVRYHLAAVNVESGVVAPWAPDLQPRGYYTSVEALASHGGVVYAGGGFTLEGHLSLAAFRSDSGSVLPWWPEPDDQVGVIHATDDAVYVGGLFKSLNGRPCRGIAALTPPTIDAGPSGSPLVLEQSIPNPVSDATTIRFRLPSSASVTLTVFDLQGRVQARLLDRASYPAGQHQVAAATTSWAAGCYVYRLQAGSEVATRKMLVIR